MAASMITGAVRPPHALADAEAGRGDVVQTLVRGMAYRESQPSRLDAEGVVDSYYGTSYWEVLEAASGGDVPPGRDRDRTLVRFHASGEQFAEEAQALYYGGGGLFFPATQERTDAWDVGRMHMKRGMVNGRQYEVSWSGGGPLAVLLGSSEASGLCMGWLPRFAGLVEPTGPDVGFSEAVRQDLQRAETVTCSPEKAMGMDCYALTTWRKIDEEGVERCRYWLAPGLDCAPILADRCGCHGADRERGYRYVSAWSDFAPVPGLRSQLPRRHRAWHLQYGRPDESGGPLHLALDVRLTWLSAQGVPVHEALLRSVFPVGVAVTQTMLAPGELPAWEVEEATARTDQLRADVRAWAHLPQERAMPELPQECADPLNEALAQEGHT